MFALLLVLLAWPTNGRTAFESAEMRPKLCRQFHGTFKWNGSASVQNVFIFLNNVFMDNNGKFIALGKGKYLTNAEITDIDVKWLIDPQNRRFEMWESNPTKANFVIDGSHIGFISDDLKSISATWTTQSTKDQGILLLTCNNQNLV